MAVSGERKSTVSSCLEAPFIEYQKMEDEDYVKKMVEFEVEEKIINKRAQFLEKSIFKCIKAGKCHDELKRELIEIKSSGLKRPRRTQHILEDATTEALATELHEGSGNVGLMSAEGVSILSGRALRDFARINKLWSSEKITVNRVTSEALIITDARLTFAIMVQPSAVSDFMAKKGDKSMGIGLMARFLVCYPSSTQGERFISASFEDEGDGLKEYLSMSKDILVKVKEFIDNPKLERKAVTFSLEAKKYWVDLFNDIEQNLQVGGRFQFAKDHGSKLAENIARIATLLTYNELGEGQSISLGILKDAEQIALHFSDTYLRCFEVQPESFHNEQALSDYLQSIRDDGDRYIKKNKIRQSGPARLRNKQVLDEALISLTQRGEVSKIICNNGMVVVDLYPTYGPDQVQWDSFLLKNNIV